MSSDHFQFDGAYYSDQFSSFTNSIDMLHELENNPNQETPIDEISCLDQIASALLSDSPPIHHLENLSLDQTQTHFHNSPDFSSLKVKTEECQFPYHSSSYDYNNNSQNSFMIQRSYSSNGFVVKPGFGSSIEDYRALSSLPPEKEFFNAQMRRVYSTGDLHNIKRSETKLSSSPLGTESSSSPLVMMDDPISKVGRYSAQERKEKIHKYRAKRNQRNFSKTIKYACRKTLADNRPRVRGRFARNDEGGDITKTTPNFNTYEDEDDFWIEGIDEGRIKGEGGLYNGHGQPQFQYSWSGSALS